ncbi:WhiB family transcriptional regulator [Streptosporangium sp. NPDC001681]|uniref:WhiB family transcriptional regulator n=1 Tax=Streptosporangium sp. NPDC001681 TaxID=3154395 RepID=UPI003332E5D8
MKKAQVRRRSIAPVGWHQDAACRGEDLSLFYGPTDDEPPEGTRKREAREKKAKKICHACPVMEKCLEWNLSFGPHQYGVGGGLTAEERRTLHRKKLRDAREAS